MAERRAGPIVLGAIALAWLPGLIATYHYDDFLVVVDNPAVHAWAAWWASMPGIRPLTKATFTFNWTVSQDAAGFVCFNVACHAVNAVMVYALVRRWLAAWLPVASHLTGGALLAALLFALHPAQTEATTYIAGRGVVLSATFALATLVAWEHARESRPSASCGGWCALAFALALAARETAWTVPFAALLADTARSAQWRDTLRRAWPLFLVLGLGITLAALSPVYRRFLAESLAERGPAANLFAQVQGIAYLVTHPLLSLRVNFDPDVPVPRAADAAWWLAAAAIAGAIVHALATLRRRPVLATGVLWFFLHLVPTNGLIARYDLVNDRQLYLALVGPALIAGAALARVRVTALRVAVAIAFVGVFAVATFVRNTDYRSERTLWEATARRSPAKPRVWNNVGHAAQQEGNLPRARFAYERALELDPDFVKARLNLEALDAAARTAPHPEEGSPTPPGRAVPNARQPPRP